mmetsp:Transcript_44820/g.82464  ORF Transcript_44820/g.82464 Transcript_44820/m.82464 type:complete len:398 (+) Transcript_44820:35-1228(+)
MSEKLKIHSCSMMICALILLSSFELAKGIPSTQTCAAPSASCQQSKCCQDKAMSCFEKNQYWASCKMNCKPGLDPNDPPEHRTPWSCKLLGGPPPTPAPPPAPPVKPPLDPSPTLIYMSEDLGTAKTTRYWDCCKPSCAWPDKARVEQPVGICSKDGKSNVPPSTNNVCGGGGSGGTSYMCSNQQPWLDAPLKLSFGYAAGHVKGLKESDFCCACYELRFTDSNLPRMVVQVTNTGSDLGENHFDIQAPGGGFGIFDGCTKQWSLSSKTAWGARYGGLMAAGLGKKGCKRMPKELQPGCEWHFDYLGDNPKIKSHYRVACPAQIANKSSCRRLDDSKSAPPTPPPTPPPAPPPAPPTGSRRRRRRSSSRRRRRARPSRRRTASRRRRRRRSSRRRSS